MGFSLKLINEDFYTFVFLCMCAFKMCATNTETLIEVFVVL